MCVAAVRAARAITRQTSSRAPAHGPRQPVAAHLAHRESLNLYADDQLARVLARIQLLDGSWSAFDALVHVFAVLQPSLSYPARESCHRLFIARYVVRGQE